MDRSADTVRVDLSPEVRMDTADAGADALGECKFLIGHLGVLEQLTTLGMSEEPVQLTASELFGVFHCLKQQAERIEALLDPEEG